MYIDFHSHILPGIDDGSGSTGETVGILEAESSQGVNLVCATPHFYAHRKSVDQFLERRNASYQHVKERQGDRLTTLPDIRLGAEVYYFSGMGRAKQLPELTLEGTDVILVEMPFEQWDAGVYRDVSEILTRQKLKVVLAHVERYVDLQKHKDIWDEIMELPLYIQLNAGSFLARGRSRRFCMKTVKERDNVILGSDCHNLRDRVPNMADAIKVIERKAGAGAVEMMQENACRLLGLSIESR